MWTYVYPAKYSDIKSEDERWKEERDRKLKEERSRNKDSVPKEDGKESTSSDCKLSTSEESRLGSKEPRPSVHVPVSSPLTQHQSYIPYMHGYSYSQSYDPNHPSYRGMPAVMMQNYPGTAPPFQLVFHCPRVEMKQRFQIQFFCSVLRLIGAQVDDSPFCNVTFCEVASLHPTL